MIICPHCRKKLYKPVEKGEKMNNAKEVLEVMKNNGIVDFDDIVMSLIEVQSKYIKHLSKDYNKMASNLIAHGYKWDNKTITRGKRLRKEMKILDKRLSELIE